MTISSGCTYLPQVPLPEAQDVPVRNPFRSGPKVKLGSLPKHTEDKQNKAPRFKKQWASQLSFLSYGLSSYPKILPAIDSEFIYQANHKGKLVILNRNNGNIHKILKLPYLVSAGPVIIEDNILIATQDAKVVCLSKKTGDILWATEVTSEVLTRPQATDKMVVVQTTDGKIVGLNLADGQIAWSHAAMMPSLTLRGVSSPYILEDFVISGLSNGKLIALNLDSGAPVWEKSIAMPQGRSDLNRLVDIRADLIVQEGAVFASAFQGNVVKIQLQTGKVLWEKPISNYQTMQVEGDALYLSDANHHVWALDSQTGATLWEQQDLAERYITAPVIVGDFIVVGDKGGYLHCLNKQTGQLQGRHFVGNKIVSDLVVDHNQILVSTQNGKLSVFKVVS